MRRIIVVIATVIVAHLTVSAQTDFKKIVINDADLARNQNLMTVTMDFDFSAFNVESNRAVLLTPYIKCGLHLLMKNNCHCEPVHLSGVAIL